MIEKTLGKVDIVRTTKIARFIDEASYLKIKDWYKDEDIAFIYSYDDIISHAGRVHLLLAITPNARIVLHAGDIIYMEAGTISFQRSK